MAVIKNIGLSPQGTNVRNHDLVFLKHFSQIIAFLVAVTLALILLGLYINGLKPAEVSEAKATQIAAAIQPQGAVYAGATGAAAQIPALRFVSGD